MADEQLIERIRTGLKDEVADLHPRADLLERLRLEPAMRERSHPLWLPSRSGGVVAMVLSIAVVGLVVAGIATVGQRGSSSSPVSPVPAGVPAGARALAARMAVLRRPQTVADRLPASIIAQEASAGGGLRIIPSLTRLAATVHAGPGPLAAVAIYVVVGKSPGYPADVVTALEVAGGPAHRHLLYAANVVDTQTAAQTGGLTPSAVSYNANLERKEWLDVGVVPDGVTRVKWVYPRPGDPPYRRQRGRPGLVANPAALKAGIAVYPHVENNVAVPTAGVRGGLMTASWYGPDGRVVASYNLFAARRIRRPRQPAGEVLYPLGAVPTLKQLLQNFAILRRPQDAADRSWKPQCSCAGAARQLTELTREAVTLPGGNRVFLDVEQFILGGQLNMAAGSYVLNLDIVDPHGNSSSEAFGPNTQYSVYPLSSGGGRALRTNPHSTQAWASVVPDGVTAVSWTFGCRGGSTTSHCSGVQPTTFTVPVVNNVAAREITLPGSCDQACASAPQVSWRTVGGRVVSFAGFGNLTAPPFVKGWRGNPVLRALEPAALGHARFGQSASTAIQTIEGMLGSPAIINVPVRDCGIDHESVWNSPTVAEPLAIYERAGRFVGYQYGAPASELGLVREPGAILETSRGLTLDDTVGTARRLYGTGLATSAAHGGVWSAVGDGGTLHGSVLPTTYPLRAVTDKNPVATIGAGETGCPPTRIP